MFILLISIIFFANKILFSNKFMNNISHKYKYFKFAFFSLLILTKLIKKKTKTKINQNENNNFRKTGDVLFISGCTYKELP